MSQNQITISPVKRCENYIYNLENRFTELSHENKTELKFKKEAQYAMQILQGNDFLVKLAMENSESLKNAILNISAIGLTLNPIKKYAYLIPRKGKVCLEISYLGLVNLACEGGALELVQAKMVSKKDTFEYNGIVREPTHKYVAFGGRGETVGVYCVAKTKGGDFLTETMDLAEINSIRDRSESFKRGGKGPWATDYSEMAKKTVIKRAYKLWPVSSSSERLEKAISVLNEHEGIDFDQEEKDRQQEIETAKEAQVKEAQKKTESKIDTIDQIKSFSEKINDGAELHEKMKFLTDVLQVKNFKELMRKPQDHLDKILENLKDLA